MKNIPQNNTLARFIVALNGTQCLVKNVGEATYFYFFLATGSFQFSLDGSDYLTGYAGMKLGPLPVGVNSMSLRCNPNGLAPTACAVVFFASNMPVGSDVCGMNLPTYAKAAALVWNAGLSSLSTGYDGINPRSQIVVTNPNPNVAQLVQVLDQNKNVFDTVPGGATKTYPGASPYYFNQTGMLLTPTVGEFFYNLNG